MPTNYTPLYVNGKKCGTFRPPDLLQKTVRASQHMLRKPKGWALDVEFLDQAERLGARRIRLDDIETGDEYSASLSLVRAQGIPINRGFGKQLALSLNFWSRNGEPFEASLKKPKQAETPQLSLFR